MCEHSRLRLTRPLYGGRATRYPGEFYVGRLPPPSAYRQPLVPHPDIEPNLRYRSVDGEGAPPPKKAPACGRLASESAGGLRYSHHPMTFAGQEDERSPERRPGDERPGPDRPGDERRGDERPRAESEGIHYFDFSDPFDPAEEATDPFASEAPADRREASFPPSRSSTRGGHGAPYQDVFEFALTGLPGASPAADASTESSASEGPTGGPTEPPSVTFASLSSLLETEGRVLKRRERFAHVFDAARADTERPFLAVALRLSDSETAAARFPVVERGIQSALEPGDVLLADFDRLRLVAVLPGRGDEAARPLFARLMSYLREHAPDAEKVGRDIVVLTAPNGQPFQRAADFLAATFDEP